jgi:hypothetical protein
MVQLGVREEQKYKLTPTVPTVRSSENSCTAIKKRNGFVVGLQKSKKCLLQAKVWAAVSFYVDKLKKTIYNIRKN